MLLADFDALSFDCYGTLIDWEAGIAAALAPWVRGRGVAAAPDDLMSAFAAIETTVQAETPTMRYPEVLAEVIRRIGRQVGAEVSDDDARSFGASVGSWPAFPDSAAALARLQTRYRLIILSNVDRASFARSAARLGAEFDLVVTAEDVGAYKPSERSFPALLQRLGSIGVSEDRLLHVAQSLYHDHVPAQAVGLPTVWIDRRHGREGTGATPAPARDVTPHWRFDSMAELAAAAVPDRLAR
jgi:2-haloalkanoic acid dehalogenase type II